MAEVNQEILFADGLRRWCSSLGKPVFSGDVPSSLQLPELTPVRRSMLSQYRLDVADLSRAVGG